MSGWKSSSSTGRERSKSITRFVKNGNRLTPDEIWEAVLMDMEATIAADRYEIETLERALATVRDDPITGRCPGSTWMTWTIGT